MTTANRNTVATVSREAIKELSAQQAPSAAFMAMMGKLSPKDQAKVQKAINLWLSKHQALANSPVAGDAGVDQPNAGDDGFSGSAADLASLLGSPSDDDGGTDGDPDYGDPELA